MAPLDALVPYGWNERWAASFASFDEDGAEPARVLRHDGAGLIVATADGTGPVPLVERVVPAPAVGDWVVLRGGTAGRGARAHVAAAPA